MVAPKELERMSPMSTILAFVPRTPAAAKDLGPSRHTPTIIIFPGVRYERLETPLQESFFQSAPEPAQRLPSVPHG